MTEPAVIRATASGDQRAVLDLVRAAFGDSPGGGSEEVDIVIGTWRAGASAEPIDLVAVDGDQAAIGHVLAARGDVEGAGLLGVAPLAVAPGHQGRGIGSALVTELLRRAEVAGWSAVVLLGDPSYYRRFGFEPAGSAGIVYPPVGPDSPHFQVKHLSTGRPSPKGRFTYCWESPVTR